MPTIGRFRRSWRAFEGHLSKTPEGPLQGCGRGARQTSFLMGDKPTVADAYVYVVTRWAERVKLDLSLVP